MVFFVLICLLFGSCSGIHANGILVSVRNIAGLGASYGVVPASSYKPFDDTYDFETHTGRFIRKAYTKAAKRDHGKGVSFDFEFRGRTQTYIGEL